ncbi:MAG: hypothetical protein M1268_00595 [Patescibacteria group bacterium]|nr:hypothetical protein [Patescibacteria group bacterium]
MKRNKLFLKTLLVSSIFLIILMLGFKKTRSLFPPPEIGNDKLIGFSQYFGYPFYFDTIFFFMLILIPICIFVILYKRNLDK